MRKSREFSTNKFPPCIWGRVGCQFWIAPHHINYIHCSSCQLSYLWWYAWVGQFLHWLPLILNMIILWKETFSCLNKLFHLLFFKYMRNTLSLPDLNHFHFLCIFVIKDTWHSVLLILRIYRHYGKTALNLRWLPWQESSWGTHPQNDSQPN